MDPLIIEGKILEIPSFLYTSHSGHLLRFYGMSGTERIWPQSGCLSVFTLLTGGLFIPFCRSHGEQSKQLPIWQQRVPGGATGTTTPAGRGPLESWNRNRRTDKIKVCYHSWKEQPMLRRHGTGTQGTGESGVTGGKCRKLSAPSLLIFFWFFWRK